MFDGLTAWFSTSVKQEKQTLWRENGGLEVNYESAKFLFSENESCEDTERIFSSDVYLDENLSVFHPDFIRECVKKGAASKAVLGKYFLPPKAVQEIGERQFRYAWKVPGYLDDNYERADGDLPVAGEPSDDYLSDEDPDCDRGYQANEETDKIYALLNGEFGIRNDLRKQKPIQSQQSQISEVYQLDKLAKVSGELTDYVVGQQGCVLGEISVAER